MLKWGAEYGENVRRNNSHHVRRHSGKRPRVAQDTLLDSAPPRGGSSEAHRRFVLPDLDLERRANRRRGLVLMELPTMLSILNESIQVLSMLPY